MVGFRRLKFSDLSFIDRIWKRFHKDKFGIPSRTRLVTEGVVEKDGTVIAYGCVHPILEATMVLDLDASQRDKIAAVRELMQVAIMDSSKSGASQLHVFVLNPDFAEVLKKHFGFQPCKGEALVLNL